VSEDHRHAPAVTQFELEFGGIKAFEQVPVRPWVPRLAIPRGQVVEAQLAVLMSAPLNGEAQEGIVDLADAQVIAPDRGRNDVVLEDAAEAGAALRARGRQCALRRAAPPMTER
jgi:hypothetical protein